MIRVLVLVLLVPALAHANPLRHEEAEALRPELASLTIRYEVQGATGWVERSREDRTYDARGRLTRLEQRTTDGKRVSTTDYQWDSLDQIVSRTHRDPAGTLERVDYTYKLDAQSRIAEKIIRVASHPAGQYLREVYTWEPDASHAVTVYRHYAKEGPYRSDTRKLDALGRVAMSCHEHGGCNMNEYDAHGVLVRIRQQDKRTHHYLELETTYDNQGRIATRRIGNLPSSYTWNARGDVVKIQSANTPPTRSIFTYRYR